MQIKIAIMKNFTKWAIMAVLTVIILLPGAVFGQRIQCKVNINTNRLPQDKKSKVDFLENELSNYINLYDWSDNEFKYNMNCQLEVGFSDVKSISYEDLYSANLVISNGVDLHYADKWWDFKLEQGENFSHDNVFHSFTSMVDFYVYLILAHEYDKLYVFGGDPYYTMAKNIVRDAKFAEQRYYRGWDDRADIVDNLMADNNKPYRKLIYHYYTGIYFYQNNQPENAGRHLAEGIKQLKEVPRDRLDRFYDISYANFSKALKSLKMNQQLEILNSFRKTER